MNLQLIVSMANINVKYRFLAMERSLRQTGCKIPIWVIPYDNNRFELPSGSSWFDDSVFVNFRKWLECYNPHSMASKYFCLTLENYHFVDADICFLRNPSDVLQSHTGFVSSCCHWRDPSQTVVPRSQSLMAQRSTTWQRNVFNAGQFACDTKLYSVEQLQEGILREEARDICLGRYTNDQVGMNYLVFNSEIKITNLTLPPICMESTWAGDYKSTQMPSDYWQDSERKPYLIHWAGVNMEEENVIDELATSLLSNEEKLQWKQEVRRENERRARKQQSLRSRLRSMKNKLASIMQ